MSGRRTANYGGSINRPVLFALSLGVVGLVIISLVVITLFAWNQWIENWPVLQNNPQRSIFNAELSSDSLDQMEQGDQNSLDSNASYQVEIVTTPAPTYWPIEPKDILAGSVPVRSRWTPTPLPTNTPIPTPSPMPTFVSDVDSGTLQPAGLRPGEKWIDVNVSTQTLVAYEGSAPVHNTLVSTGTANHPTVIGQFRIWLRFTSQDMNGYRLGYDYYLKGVPYVQYFYEDYALHGTFWHSNFGHPMSHGCVNLSPSDAEWLFHWADYGTLVNIHK